MGKASRSKRLIESQGLREAQLGDFLNDNQMQACIDILNRPDIDDIAQTKELKRYLNQFKVDLEAKGILPDYLAYVLIANADALRQMAARRTGLN